MNETAIHEAGHAVAHVRLGFQQSRITIVPDHERGAAGAVTAESDDWSAEQGADQVLAYCAGYAALIAAGYSEDVAVSGADSDFELGEAIVDCWALPGGIEAMKRRAVEMMSEPRNFEAVSLVTEYLLIHRTIDGEIADVLVDVADGETTEAEFEQYLAFRRQIEIDT